MSVTFAANTTSAVVGHRLICGCTYSRPEVCGVTHTDREDALSELGEFRESGRRLPGCTDDFCVTFLSIEAVLDEDEGPTMNLSNCNAAALLRLLELPADSLSGAAAPHHLLDRIAAVDTSRLHDTENGSWLRLRMETLAEIAQYAIGRQVTVSWA